MPQRAGAPTSKPDAQWKALADGGHARLAWWTPASTDIGVFCVEAGRALCPRVVQSTLYAATGRRLARRRIRLGCLRLTSGEARGTSALFNPRDASDVTPRLRVRRDGDAWRVSGDADFVADADLADVIVATADAEVVGGRRQHRQRGRRSSRVPMMGGLSGVHGPASTTCWSTSRRLWTRNSCAAWPMPLVALDCLDLVGVGEAVIDRTVDYTKMREQFGRPIASFQAAQHLVADMHIALAAARLAAHSAVFRIGQGDTATRETAVARMRAAEVKKITLDAHQLHGGMGYVVDTGLHLFSERARVLSTLGGGADIAAKWLQDEMNWDRRTMTGQLGRPGLGREDRHGCRRRHRRGVPAGLAALGRRGRRSQPAVVRRRLRAATRVPRHHLPAVVSAVRDPRRRGTRRPCGPTGRPAR